MIENGFVRKYTDTFTDTNSLFVDREEETALFLKTIRAELKTKYLEFVGVSGQGKTELLKWINRKSRKEGYLTAYIDFSQNQFQRPEIYPILQEIADQIRHEIETGESSAPFQSFQDILPKYLEVLREFYKDSWLSDSVDSKPYIDLEENLTKAFRKDFGELIKSNTVVLCLDSTEQTYKRAFREFEYKILSYFTNDSNFMLVSSGQTPIKWEDKTFPPEARGSVRSSLLKPLDKKSAVRQIESIAKHEGRSLSKPHEIGDKLFEITLGHPLSNFQLVEYWLSETEKDKPQVSPELVEEQLNGGIRELAKRFIEKQIFRSVYIDPNIYPSPVEILRCLSPLRFIEFGILWFALKTFLPTWFAGKPFSHTERLFKSLTTSFVFSSVQFGTGYMMEPVVRNILLQDLKRNYNKNYRLIQEQITKRYDFYVHESHDDSRIKFFVEHFYHLACTLSLEEAKNINNKLKEVLDKFLKRTFMMDGLVNPEMAIQQLFDLENKLEQEKRGPFSIANLGTNVDIEDIVKKVKRFRMRMRTG